MTFDDQTAVFMCLPKPDPRTGGLPWSPWTIYARLEGREHSAARHLNVAMTLDQVAAEELVSLSLTVPGPTPVR